MSGTSADGIDLALVSFDPRNNNKLKHHASYYQVYTNETAIKIQSLYKPGIDEIDRAFSLDIELAQFFSHAIHAFLVQEKLTCSDIIAIGSHGQTIRHRPQQAHAFTLQIGCCQTLATLTNIRVIGQFRRKDMALGGQGAPLVPAFHQTIFSENNSINTGADVFVINIGGIANLTFLPATNTHKVIGYDTGPGNALMDDWFNLHNPNNKANYDENGHWAKQGQINHRLLMQLLSDDYFSLPFPKSTGREYFHLLWLNNILTKFYTINSDVNHKISNEDVQATLTALTAITIVNAVVQHKSTSSSTTKIYLCGGGTHNAMLKAQIAQQLQQHDKKYELLLTDEKNIDSDQLEAIAFAWLAFAYDKKLLSSMSTVTGASKCCTLGNVYFP